MFAFQYRIAESTIPGAGRGVFAAEALPQGKVLIFPNDRHTLLTEEQRAALPIHSMELASTIRWFEQTYTTDPEWSDECFLNHSFSPNGVWILGFVFALCPIAAGEELTIDYRMLLAAGETCDFADAATGQPIVGHAFPTAMLAAAAALQSMFGGA
jgi:SET domain-containing protein